MDQAHYAGLSSLYRISDPANQDRNIINFIKDQENKGTVYDEHNFISETSGQWNYIEAGCCCSFSAAVVHIDYSFMDNLVNIEVLVLHHTAQFTQS